MEGPPEQQLLVWWKESDPPAFSLRSHAEWLWCHIVQVHPNAGYKTGITKQNKNNLYPSHPPCSTMVPLASSKVSCIYPVFSWDNMSSPVLRNMKGSIINLFSWPIMQNCETLTCHYWKTQLCYVLSAPWCAALISFKVGRAPPYLCSISLHELKSNSLGHAMIYRDFSGITLWSWIHCLLFCDSGPCLWNLGEQSEWQHFIAY